MLVNDGIGTGRGSDLMSKSVVLDQLLHLLRLEIVGEQGHRAIAVGKEINGVADPHRVEVVGIVAGNGGLST